MSRRRLTDLPGVAHGLPRTPDGARTALRRYEDQNTDLPASAQRLLALSAVARYFGRTVLEEAVGSDLPRAPFRDWSWRWWNVLYHSGLGEHWNVFARRAQSQGIRAAATYLRTRVAPDAYLHFLRRAGTNVHNGHREKQGDVLWTKGGCWRIESPFTILLVQKKHLPPRPLVRRWQKKLGHAAVTLIEKELMHFIDPDRVLVHEARQLALDYVSRRIPDILAWPKQRAGPKVLAWFFQARIVTKDCTVEPVGAGWYTWSSRSRHPFTW